MGVIEEGSLTWAGQLRRNFNRLLERRWTNVGLRAKMGLLVEVGLIALISIFLFLGVSTARQTTQKILSERMMLARLSAATIDSTLRQVQSIVELINESRLTGGSAADISTNQGLLEAVYAHLANASSGVLLFAPDGELMATTGETLDPAEIASLQGALLGYDETSGSQLITLPANPLHTFILTRLDLDEDDPRPGFMAVLLNLQGTDFAPLRASIDLGKTGKLDVIDAEGRVLVSSHPETPSSPDSTEKIWSRFFTTGKPKVETCLGCTESGAEEGTDEVVAFAPLSQAPWGVIVRQKASELMAPVNRLLVQTLLLGLVTVIGALFLVWVTTNNIIWPVQMLKEATERITQGDLDTPIKMPAPGWLYGRATRRDEIGDLAESFSTMRRQLKRSMDEVIALNRELDARVHERTQVALEAQHEAQAARDDLRAIIDALSDELIVVNVEDHSIQLANRQVQNRNPGGETFIGQDCSHVCNRSPDCPDCPDSNCVCPIPLVVTSGNPVRVTHQIPLPGAERRIYKEISASPMRDNDGQITRVVELKRDVTEKEELEESLIRRNQQLSILNAISMTVNQSLNLEEILNQALEAVLKLTEIDVGAVFLQEEMQGSLKLMAYRGLSQQAARYAAEVGMLDGSCGGVMDHGQIVIVADLSHYKSKRARTLQRENLNTLVHIPLIAKDCILGSMCVGTRHRRDFSEEEQELLSSIGSQIAIAIDNARLYAEVQAKERVRGELLMKIIGAQEEERKRIARELHDETSQSLAALLFAFEEGLEMDEVGGLHDRLKKMHDLTQNTLDGVHKMIFDLRPSVLDHLGLVPAILWFAETRLEPKGVRLSLEDFPTPLRLPPEIETSLFRIVQEAILNIARHAAARNVLIRFSTSGRDVWVEVEDDGVGFDASQLTPDLDSMRGIGLLGMQERLEILGGDLEIHSTPGSGTRLLIHVPVEIVSTPLA